MLFDLFTTSKILTSEILKKISISQYEFDDAQEPGMHCFYKIEAEQALGLIEQFKQKHPEIKPPIEIRNQDRDFIDLETLLYEKYKVHEGATTEINLLHYHFVANPKSDPNWKYGNLFEILDEIHREQEPDYDGFEEWFDPEAWKKVSREDKITSPTSP